jgi:hypothetical protein
MSAGILSNPIKCETFSALTIRFLHCRSFTILTESCGHSISADAKEGFFQPIGDDMLDSASTKKRLLSASNMQVPYRAIHVLYFNASLLRSCKVMHGQLDVHIYTGDACSGSVVFVGKWGRLTSTPH